MEERTMTKKAISRFAGQTHIVPADALIMSTSTVSMIACVYQRQGDSAFEAATRWARRSHIKLEGLVISQPLAKNMYHRN